MINDNFQVTSSDKSILPSTFSNKKYVRFLTALRKCQGDEEMLIKLIQCYPYVTFPLPSRQLADLHYCKRAKGEANW